MKKRNVTVIPDGTSQTTTSQDEDEVLLDTLLVAVQLEAI